LRPQMLDEGIARQFLPERRRRQLGDMPAGPAAHRDRLAESQIRHLVQPLRFFRTQQHRHGDSHMFALRTRFIPDDILGLFERLAWPVGASGELSAPKITTRVDVAARMRDMWH
jgi:hypothetical protein